MHGHVAVFRVRCADRKPNNLDFPEFPPWHVSCIVFRCAALTCGRPERRSSNGDLPVKLDRVRIVLMSLIGGLLFANQAVADEKLKVAFVEFSQASGSSWVRANTESAKYLQEHVPDLDITRVESVADGPGVVPVINNLIATGNKLIFANSYRYVTFIPKLPHQPPCLLGYASGGCGKGQMGHCPGRRLVVRGAAGFPQRQRLELGSVLRQGRRSREGQQV